VLTLSHRGRGFGPLKLLHFGFGLWLLVNILYNYISCVRTPPGKPPPGEREQPPFPCAVPRCC